MDQRSALSGASRSRHGKSLNNKMINGIQSNGITNLKNQIFVSMDKNSTEIIGKYN